MRPECRRLAGAAGQEADFPIVLGHLARRDFDGKGLADAGHAALLGTAADHAFMVGSAGVAAEPNLPRVTAAAA
jgi:hypothetical protein